jgi:L-alanine-DL-glutamate epimerase-like enolase superfamily enzyme
MVKDLAERLVVGHDPHRIEELWSRMYDHCFWAKGGGPIAFAAISVIEQLVAALRKCHPNRFSKTLSRDFKMFS